MYYETYRQAIINCNLWISYYNNSLEYLSTIKLTNMEFETIQQAIDHSINVVTHKATLKEMHTLRQEGIILKGQEDINALVLDMRADVQRMLEQSN